MPNILVRDVEEIVLEKLKEQAKRNGRSMQSEVLSILNLFAENAEMSDEQTAATIKKSLRGRTFSDSAALLREDRRR